MTDAELAQWQRTVEARIEAFAETRRLYVDELRKLQAKIVDLELRVTELETGASRDDAVAQDRRRRAAAAATIGGLAVGVLALVLRLILGG